MATTIGVSALVDVLFILLVFIIVGARFERVRGLEVDLSDADVPPTQEKGALAVTVPKDGPIRIEDRDVPAAELDQTLRRLRAEHADLVLFADGAIALERAVVILTSARQVGFTSLTIAAEQPSGTQGAPDRPIPSELRGDDPPD